MQFINVVAFQSERSKAAIILKLILTLPWIKFIQMTYCINFHGQKQLWGCTWLYYSTVLWIRRFSEKEIYGQVSWLVTILICTTFLIKNKHLITIKMDGFFCKINVFSIIEGRLRRHAYTSLVRRFTSSLDGRAVHFSFSSQCKKICR